MEGANKISKQIKQEREPDAVVIRQVFLDKPKRSGKIPVETTLPEEVWLIIFDELKDERDWQSCCLASPYLSSVLDSSKPLWKFKKAVSSIAKYLPINELLKCRLVCKQWEEDIGTHLQSRLSYPSKEGRHFYTFTTVAGIRHFLEKFSDHPKNPFVDRTVYFYDQSHEPDFGPEVDRFMDRFGRHIWNLRMGGYDRQPTRLYHDLHVALTKATGLKHFRFEGEALDLAGDQQRNRDVMSTAMLRYPLPFIPTLESLWFQVMNCGEELQSLVMLPYATQLKSLCMNMQAWKPFYARGLVNLRELVMEDVLSDEKLGKLLQLNAPIERMSLAFGQNLRAQVSLTLLMKLLKKFPLKDLTLMFGDEGVLVEPEEEEDDAASVRIPTLKKLFVSQGNQFSYNCLQAFPNLENLTVQVETQLGELGQETDEDVKLYKMMKNGGCYESNIWRKLPKLKRVHIYDSTYDEETGIPFYRFHIKGTRAEYERYQAANNQHQQSLQ